MYAIRSYYAEFVAFKNEAKAVAKLMDQIDYEESLSLADYYTIYKAYSRMSDQVKKTDEDVFPLLMESFAFLYKDSLSDHQPLMVGEEKAAFQCAEHGVLSAVTTLWKSLGASVALYEASKTNTELLGDNEVKALLSYYRAFLFLQHGLYYLSEKEYTENIVWLDNNKFVNLPITKSFFGWERLPNERAYVGFHALNYLARGLTRLAMPYEKDNELGIDDLDVFLDDFEELNIQHECVWSIQAYLYLHRNQPEEAIGSLKKLQASKILSSDEQKVIAESIVYLEKREGDALLSGVYDKVFLTRVATSYVYSIIKKTDWEKILKDNDVPHADDMIIALKKLEHIRITSYNVCYTKLLRRKRSTFLFIGNKIYFLSLKATKKIDEIICYDKKFLIFNLRSQF